MTRPFDAALTALALLAFAANSLLCRLALAHGGIDPASFTTIRLGSGAIVLFALQRSRKPGDFGTDPSWIPALLLLLYAAPFAFAYRRVTAGTGALLLFGAVQLTMIFGSWRAGQKPRPAQWLGLGLALAGLIYLVLPGITAPPADGAGLMLLAGLAWGLYSLKGRAVPDPLAQTAVNFGRAAPLAVGISLLALTRASVDARGALLATASGALASGLGYVVWYRALPRLPAIVASMVQLAVPPLAALGGAAFLGEPLTVRLGIATTAILGGIALALVPRGSRTA